VAVRAPEGFDTERLHFERVGLGHAEDLAALMRDPRVMKTLWPWSTGPTPEQISASLRSKMAHWERHGFGMWALHERSSGDFIGRGGLQYTDALGARAVEVAWAVIAERWREGFATELALASLEVGFNDLGLAEVIAFTLLDNIASRRVMEKAGFRYDRAISHAGLPHVLYRRPRPQDDARPPLENGGLAGVRDPR
jgi:RimJ/RimL family protein N-acetyltransferase